MNSEEGGRCKRERVSGEGEKEREREEKKKRKKKCVRCREKPREFKIEEKIHSVCFSL